MNLNGVKISEDMQDLLRKMITFSPKDRIIFQKLFKHKLFIDDYNESSKNPGQIISPFNSNSIFILVISDEMPLAQ